MYFSKIILELIENKMNLMVSEIVQCFMKDIKLDLDNPDHEKMVIDVLENISTGKVKSAHIDDETAKKVLDLYHKLNDDMGPQYNMKIRNKDDDCRTDWEKLGEITYYKK